GRKEIVLGDLQGVGDVVERSEQAPCGRGGQGVQVVDRHLRSVTGGQGGGQARVEVVPLDHGGLHRDVLVLGVELVHQVLHHRSVPTGETVPKRQLDSGAVVGLAAATSVGASAAPAAGATGHDCTAAGGGQRSEDPPTAEGRVSSGCRVHANSFVMAGGRSAELLRRSEAPPMLLYNG